MQLLIKYFQGKSKSGQKIGNIPLYIEQEVRSVVVFQFARPQTMLQREDPTFCMEEMLCRAFLPHLRSVYLRDSCADLFAFCLGPSFVRKTTQFLTTLFFGFIRLICAFRLQRSSCTVKLMFGTTQADCVLCVYGEAVAQSNVRSEQNWKTS